MTYLLLAISIYWALGIAFYASKRESYDHSRDTISELGEAGSAYEMQVAYAVFVPVGLGLMAIAYALHASDQHLSLLCGFMGLSYFLSAFFPCDPGTPLSGSWKNAVHNLIGGVCYAAMVYQLRELSELDGGAHFDVSFMLLAGFLIAFVIGWPKRLIGLAQRVAEASVLISVLIALNAT